MIKLLIYFDDFHFACVFRFDPIVFLTEVLVFLNLIEGKLFYPFFISKIYVYLFIII